VEKSEKKVEKIDEERQARGGAVSKGGRGVQYIANNSLIVVFCSLSEVGEEKKRCSTTVDFLTSLKKNYPSFFLPLCNRQPPLESLISIQSRFSSSE